MPQDDAYEAQKARLLAMDNDLGDMQRRVSDQVAKRELLSTEITGLEKELREKGVDVDNLETWIAKEDQDLTRDIGSLKEQLAKVEGG